MTQDSNIQDETAFKDKLQTLRILDPKNIKQRAGGTNRSNNSQIKFDYVEWHVVADMLDELAPNWTSTIKDIRQIGDFMTVIVAISIDGVSREGIGTGVASTEMGIKKAEHDALKRAAVKFGIGRELYKKESSNIDRAGSNPGSRYSNSTFDATKPPATVKATNNNDLISPNQVSRIHKTADRFKLVGDEVCQHFLKCRVAELNRKGASWLIELLDSQEFRQTHAAAGNPNVVHISDRTAESPVSPSVAGKLLFDSGNVRFEDGDFYISQKLSGKPVEFPVRTTEAGRICECGDFKTQTNVKKVAGYKCAHIVAADLYESAKKSA